MKKKCPYCFSKIAPDAAACPVCAIDPKKDKAALISSEKRIANRCRELYTIGFLMIVGGVIGIFVMLPAIFLSLQHKPEHDNVFLPVYVATMPILLLLLSIYGFALRRYKKWCYSGGIVLVALIILETLFEMQIIVSILFLYFLYCIASSPSRRILSQ